MSIPAKAEINRANAQHSTGPKTEAGKKKSSMNALRHGLTSKVVTMPAEEVEPYQRHLKEFFDDLQPVGVIEESLVQSLADCSWRQNRIMALESFVLLEADYETTLKTLANLSLYSQRLSRQFEKTANQLRGLQKTRKEQDQTEMYEDKGETSDPSADGFVFSEDREEAIEPRPGCPLGRAVSLSSTIHCARS